MTRRFHVELFIVHPTLTPDEISRALRRTSTREHAVGTSRPGPPGATHADTRWRQSVEHVVDDQWFSRAVASFVDGLLPHKVFLASLGATGGRAQVIIQFLGDGYHGDTILAETLAKLVELGLSLGLEVYGEPQT